MNSVGSQVCVLWVSSLSATPHVWWLQLPTRSEKSSFFGQSKVYEPGMA